MKFFLFLIPVSEEDRILSSGERWLLKPSKNENKAMRILCCVIENQRKEGHRRHFYKIFHYQHTEIFSEAKPKERGKSYVLLICRTELAALLHFNFREIPEEKVNTQRRCELTPYFHRAYMDYLKVGSFWGHSAHINS